MPPAPAAARDSPPPPQVTPTPQPAPPGARSTGNRGWLAVGLLLAAGGTAAVFFTDDARYLRVALLAVCWAFVVAAFVAGNRRADQVAAAGREAELKHAYDLELEREVTARHQFEVELEGRLRRETEGAVRGELAQLRAELSGLSTLREDLAAVPRLRAELAGLGQLRTELAALTEIRGELSGLGQLRAELTEQLSGELLVERMVMRAQSVRGPAQSAPEADGRVLDGATVWDSPPQTSGWDVDRWTETRVVPAQPLLPVAHPPAVDGTPQPAPEPVVDSGAGYDSSRYDALLFGTTTPSGASSYDPPWSGSSSADAWAVADGVERAGSTAYGARHDASGYAGDATAAPADEPVRAAAPESPGHARLEQILAESGVPAPTGARSRRRRHREDAGDATDDVLARVLGRR
ncbi:DUF6779 domain-containing protein [Modestobacter altitudinis]|uniref:DUF6779 domain-containing protein n=1 Tax=Modestobacter altitudinis TaxID=2213158 RepID=UPI00110CA1AC|nr:DUF6779 domain-containing protein [Modestobacter altitudinis]